MSFESDSEIGRGKALVRLLRDLFMRTGQSAIGLKKDSVNIC